VPAPETFSSTPVGPSLNVLKPLPETRHPPERPYGPQTKQAAGCTDGGSATKPGKFGFVKSFSRPVRMQRSNGLLCRIKTHPQRPAFCKIQASCPLNVLRHLPPRMFFLYFLFTVFSFLFVPRSSSASPASFPSVPLPAERQKRVLSCLFFSVFDPYHGPSRSPSPRKQRGQGGDPRRSMRRVGKGADHHIPARDRGSASPCARTAVPPVRGLSFCACQGSGSRPGSAVRHFRNPVRAICPPIQRSCLALAHRIFQNRSASSSREGHITSH